MQQFKSETDYMCLTDNPARFYVDLLCTLNPNIAGMFMTAVQGTSIRYRFGKN